jgi:hypothetical protein
VESNDSPNHTNEHLSVLVIVRVIRGSFLIFPAGVTERPMKDLLPADARLDAYFAGRVGAERV